MAIKIEKHDGLTRTYSDAGRWIIQDETGPEYIEAWDPIDYPRSYTESERIIESEYLEEPSAPEHNPADTAMLRAAEIMLGGDE